MEAFALSRHNRISTKKINRVAISFRNMRYPVAINILNNLPQKGAYFLRKTLQSAGANLQNKSPESSEVDWKIKEIQVNQGPAFKRIKPRARGRADRILKPTTHIKVVITDDK